MQITLLRGYERVLLLTTMSTLIVGIVAAVGAVAFSKYVEKQEQEIN